VLQNSILKFFDKEASKETLTHANSSNGEKQNKYTKLRSSCDFFSTLLCPKIRLPARLLETRDCLLSRSWEKSLEEEVSQYWYAFVLLPPSWMQRQMKHNSCPEGFSHSVREEKKRIMK
jgi:hypothetical protein